MWDILVVAMRRMPSAAATRSRPSGLATRASSARLASSMPSLILPPRKRSAPSENEIGIGDGGLGAAESVAHRAGLGARASRPNVQRAHVRARDRAAAGADLLDIDHRDLHRQPGGIAADERAPGYQHVAIMNVTGLGRGAAHVEGDRVLEPNTVAQRLSADDPGSGSGFEHPNARALRLLHPEQAAGRLHDQKIAVEAGGLEMLTHFAEIAAHARAEIGIRCRRRGALELAVFLRKLVRRGDEEMRVGLLDDLFRALLVRGIAVGVQKQDGERLYPLPHRIGHGCAYLLLVERDEHLALCIHALADLVAQVALDQRLVAAEEEVVGFRPIDAADLVDIAEALRGEER